MNDLKNIWEEHLSGKEKYIKSKLENTGIFNAYAATNQITDKRLFLLELSPGTSDFSFKKAKFGGLAIQILEFPANNELTILLLDNSLEDIFIAFIENILDEIVRCATEAEALNKVYDVILRWKKLFDKAASAVMTLEQQKGLFGELLLLDTLIFENYEPKEVLSSWCGPMHGDKDFIFGSVGIEVKLTSSKYPSIKITNERQLENTALEKLYLFLYIVEEVRKNGITLPELANVIRIKLSFNAEMLKIFEERLALSGFLIDEEEHYTQQYFLKALNKYEVNHNFPRIISSNLDQGIYNVSYRIELSACEPQKIISETISELINGY